MKKKTFLLTLSLAATLCASAQQLPYQNTSLSWEQRTEDLLGRLTLEEKTKLMMNRSVAIERLGIPHFEWWNEALHGVGRNGFATVFPITTAMAASWDDALLQKVFDAVSDEARVKAQQAKRSGSIKQYQSLSFWTPNINIFRDPRWGRGQETYGEDPYLTAQMGMAVVRGLQGPDNAKYRKLLACAKHFAVHSGPEWNRHTFNVEDLPERDLWETYLPAFKALVQEAGVEEIMCAYQRIDGEPCCAQSRYEQQILRDEWGFKGLITSDCGAINDFLPRYHNVVETPEQAVAIGVRAGTDVECGSLYRHLPEAVAKGWISEKEIDTSLRRLIMGRMKLGDFDPDDMVEWTKIPENVVASKEHKELALQMAREGIVLLKNNGILPLKQKNIVVMGPNACDSVMMWGNYSGYPTYTITAMQGLQNVLKKQVKYIPGCGLTRSEVMESFYNQFVTPEGKRGLKGTYWNNEQMEGQPVATAVYAEPIKLNNGGATVFAPGVELEHFSARYEGSFKASQDEQLQLYINADDKMRILLNGDTVVNVWQSRRRSQEATRDLNIEAGKEYQLVIEYVQEDNMANMQFDIRKRYTPTRDQLLADIGKAKVVVFVGGISPRVEGEQMRVEEPGFKGGDRTSIELPQAQRDLLRTLHEAGKQIIFVNCSGGAVALSPEAEYCDAILQAWYGGEQGGTALAEVITGKTNPSGKLPLTFYKDDTQLPDFLDYRMKGRTYRYFEGEPLYPFGYGLSYTSFNISNPQYNAGQHTVACTIKNTGKREGTETVQVYIRRTADTEGPLKTLRAYQRVTLKAGESRQVAIAFPRDRFENWDASTNTMRVVPGEYELMVGTSSADKDLQRFTVNIQ
ncbi:MAG: glycoside hydrolase family 3 C-terminal domain-containing protein [Prevotella sp.]|nr:glycoside hydrolase family 3 C-terminal domain-containing protein [Prevotella sp.]